MSPDDTDELSQRAEIAFNEAINRRDVDALLQEPEDCPAGHAQVAGAIHDREPAR